MSRLIRNSGDKQFDRIEQLSLGDPSRNCSILKIGKVRRKHADENRHMSSILTARLLDDRYIRDLGL